MLRYLVILVVWSSGGCHWNPLMIIDKSTLAQIMAWCRQAPSHYLSQCWSKSISPYGVSLGRNVLTHWGRVTHICVSKLTIIGSDNGLSPGRRQSIIWTNAGILLIGPRGTNFSEMLIKIYTFSFKKMHFKMSSGKRQPFCLGLNVLTRGVPVLGDFAFSRRSSCSLKVAIKP